MRRRGMKTGVVLLYLSGSAPALGTQYTDAGVGDSPEYEVDAGVAESSVDEMDTDAADSPEFETDAGAYDTEAARAVVAEEDSDDGFDDWDAYLDEDDLIYETEVVGYRPHLTDKVTGFGETIEVLESRKRVTDVAEVLSHSVGVQVRSMGGLGAYGAASIRGSTPNQVPVFIDNVALNMGGFSAVNLGDFSLNTLESIEVYRGNVPLVLGTGGIGGAIVLKTRTFDEPLTEFAASYGSWNTWRLFSLYAAEVCKWQVLSIVSGQHSDGDFIYFNRNGTIYNTDDDEFVRRSNNHTTAYSLMNKLQRTLGALDIQVLDDFYYKRQGLSGLDHAVNASKAKLDTLRNAVNLRLEHGGSDKLTVTGDIGHIVLFERYWDMNGSIGTGHQDNEYRTNGVFGAGRLTADYHEKHTTTVRLSTRYEIYDEHRVNRESSEQQSPMHRVRGELGAEHDYKPIPPLHIVPTLRGEILYSYFGGGEVPALLSDFPPTSQTKGYFSPSLGVRYEPIDGLLFRANGGRYNRTPDLSELFGDRGSVTGNPELKAEVGYNADAGVTYRYAGNGLLDRFRIDAAWFGSWVDNLIAYIQNSQSTSRAENISSARILGAEFALRMLLFDILELSGNYTFFNGVDRSDDEDYRDNPLPGRPIHAAYGRIDLTKVFDRVGFGGWFDADYSGKSYVKRYTDLSAVAMHFYLGLGARLTLPKAGFTFTFEVKNLLDALIFKNEEGDWLPMSDYDRYPLPGRTFLGTIHWQRPTQERNRK